MASVVVILVGCLALVGWEFNITAFKSVLPGLAPMKVNTALSFILSGIAFGLLQIKSQNKWLRTLSLTSAAMVTLIGGLILSQHLFGWDFKIDQLFFKEASLAEGISHPVRMSPMAAFNFILIGFALFLLNIHSRFKTLVQWLSVVIIFSSLLALIAYTYDIRSLDQIKIYSTMAFHTVITFFILGFGILFWRPQLGFTNIFISDSAGGQLARRLIPLAIFLPFVVGWLADVGEESGLYNVEFEAALSTSLTIVIITTFIWFNARSLQTIDTHHMQIEERLQRLNDRLTSKTIQLQDANKELDAFSYSVSHDLKAPLRIIDGFSMALLEDYGDKVDPEAKDLLCTIRNNTKKMGELIEDLLRFSRIGRQEMTQTDIDMTDLAQNVFEELKINTPKRNITFHMDVLPPTKGDLAMMRQVFANLLSNAIKYTRPKEKAIIEVGSKNGGNNEMIYFVKDNGVGFDMQYANKLFGVFQRLHAQDQFEGAGVGLALVQRIIQKHGGKTWAEASVNKGATFYFTLKKGANV